jgi:hypothetical protein
MIPDREYDDNSYNNKLRSQHSQWKRANLQILQFWMNSSQKVPMAINRNQILIEILDRNNPKGGFSLAL